MKNITSAFLLASIFIQATPLSITNKGSLPVNENGGLGEHEHGEVLFGRKLKPHILKSATRSHSPLPETTSSYEITNNAFSPFSNVPSEVSFGGVVTESGTLGNSVSDNSPVVFPGSDNAVPAVQETHIPATSKLPEILKPSESPVHEIGLGKKLFSSIEHIKKHLGFHEPHHKEEVPSESQPPQHLTPSVLPVHKKLHIPSISSLLHKHKDHHIPSVSSLIHKVQHLKPTLHLPKLDKQALHAHAHQLLEKFHPHGQEVVAGPADKSHSFLKGLLH